MTDPAIQLQENPVMTIQMIPLNMLRLSPHNVRKTGAERNLDELVANIEAKGVLQNLIGGAAKKKGFYDIFAGGRRLRALNQLADAGKIAADYLVPVNVLEETAKGVSETSLAENFIREQMTPTDECLAFLHFLGSDGDIDAVAKRFGQTRRFVEGRLRLATLAEPIFDTLAAGEMTMEVAKAYAATPDQAKQLAVFDEVGGSWLASNAHEIRKRILGASIPATHPVALLVGEERYTQAGGRIARDLFTDKDSAEWLDGDLATKLAASLLEEAAARHAEETGIGTVIPLLAKSSTWTDREDLTQARLERAPLSPEAEARIAAIADEHAAFERRAELEELTDEEIEAMNAEIETLEAEEADLRNTEVTIDDERKATLTQFVVIGEDGQPRVEPGYWQEPQNHTHGGAGQGGYTDPRKAAAKAQGLTGVLADELAMARRDVLALHIASNPQIALNLAIFTLADRMVGRSTDGCSLAVNRRNDPIVRNGLPDSQAGAALAEMRKQLDVSWADHLESTDRFDAFCALDDEARANWLAVCVSSSIEASLGGKSMGRHNAFHDHLGQLLEIDVASWWRPSAGGYFARVRKTGMQSALNAIGGPVLAAKYASAKTAEMANACEKLCDGSAMTDPEIRDAGLAWLPTAMRFDNIGDDSAADEPGAEESTEALDESDADSATDEDQTSNVFDAYYALKDQHEGTVLLFRMGDYYEVFGSDAVTLGPILGVVTTKRSTELESTDMLGIPVHSAETSIEVLVKNGIAVAIAEPVEDGEYAVIRTIGAPLETEAAAA